jgi:hypothetical protein
VARATKPVFVDTGNPALAVECPRCGLLTPRFLQYCRNCSFSLWPSTPVASAAFQAWRDADPSRRRARRFDLEPPVAQEPPVVDYEERAHRLGIHIFPPSSYPFIICLGFLFLGLAAVPFAGIVRLVLLVLGLVIFLVGVGGWVIFEDTRMYEQVVSEQSEIEEPAPHAPEEQTH